MSADDRVQGLTYNVSIKAPCRAATTANISFTGLQTIDGVILAAGDRVLVKDQTDAVENGIYVCNTGAWSRDVDFGGARDCVQGTVVLVIDGTQGQTFFQLDTEDPVIGQTSIDWIVSGAAALALASAYMRDNILPLTTKEDVQAALDVPSLTDNNTLAGDQQFDGETLFNGAAEFVGDIAVPDVPRGTASALSASTRFVSWALGSAALRGYIDGCIMSWNNNTRVDVGAGVAVNSTNAQAIVISAGTIDCATVGANGLDAGSLANTTWYHAFAIAKADGTAALLASTSLTPALPSGYTVYRRIGSFRTDGSAHIISFVQDGDDFWWSSPVLADGGTFTDPGTSAVTRTLTVPTGVKVQAFINVLVSAGGAAFTNCYISDLAVTDVAPSGFSDTDPIVLAVGLKYVRTNTSAQVRSRLSFSDAGTSFVINTLGWIDPRGRNS